MNNIHPAVMPASIHPAEARVHEALLRCLPKDWEAFYSLKIRTPDGDFGECDFVLIHPDHGIWLVEVKGGNISKRNGIWYANGFEMEESPLEQVHGFRNKLLHVFRGRPSRLPQIQALVVFPDIDFDNPPQQGDLREIVLGRQDLSHLDTVLHSLATKFPVSFPGSGLWQRDIRALWEENWIPTLRLATLAAGEEARRIPLDEQQIMILQGLEGNPRVLIEGEAGTGKSILARQAAEREHKAGRRVFLTCFTDALGRVFQDDAGAEAGALQRFAQGLIARKGGGSQGAAVNSDGDPEHWRMVSLEAAALVETDDRFDAIVIDEAQDLSDEDWMLIEALLGPDGRLWMFADRGQGFWQERQIPARILEGAVRFHLGHPYRCPEAIQVLARGFRDGGSLSEEALGTLRAAKISGQIGVITASRDRITKQLIKEIDRLRSQGFAAHDIAILSLRGKQDPDNIVNSQLVGEINAVEARDPSAGSHIICDTFLRFKGLERPAILVTDLRLTSRDDNKRNVRLYIACTRALAVLRIVGVEEAVRADPLVSAVLDLG